MSTIIPSPQQTAIFAHARSAHANLIVDAKAGSGKTTTLIELLKCLPVRNPGELSSARIRFLAFNKLIADTLSARCPKHVVCSTFHSLGLSALKASGFVDPEDARSREWVNGTKCRKLVWNACDREDPDITSIIRLVGLTKSVAVLPENIDFAMLEAFAYAHSMNLENPRRAFEVVRSVAMKSFSDLSSIDFDDMLYLPVMLGCAFDWQDWVMCDEAQDTNDIQVEILTRLAKSFHPTDDYFNPTRFVFVGDPHQAIYGFRGANSDAMTRIAQRFACETLPLSVSYRCSRSVIREAKLTVPDIEHREGAPEGEVKTLDEYSSTSFVPGSAILCRNTAPLVGHAYAMLTRDIPCLILGKDIGANLIALVRKLRAATLPDFHEKLAKWVTREIERAKHEDRSPEAVFDQADCLRMFASSLDEDSQTVASLIAKIELMFTDDTTRASSRVTLSTIHKAKGLEYETVFLLDRALISSRYATQPAQQKQERNLLYVARTRAKTNLYYITSDAWRNEKTTLA